MHLHSLGYILAIIAAVSTAAAAQDTPGVASPGAGDPRGPYADALIASGAEMHGWWGVLIEDAPPEEEGAADASSTSSASREVLAINLSMMTEPDAEDAAALMALCSQGEVYFAYMPRRLSPGGADADLAERGEGDDEGDRAQVPTDGADEASQWIAARRAGNLRLVRLAFNDRSLETAAWIVLRDGTGLFLHDAAARHALQKARLASSLSIELNESRERIASRFDLDGVDTAVRSVVEACSAQR